MGRTHSPAGDATARFTGIPGSPDRDVTFATDSITITKPQKTRMPMEVQGGRTRHNTKIKPGMITATLVTDDPDGTADWMQNVEGSTMVIACSNDRRITLRGVTHATEEGVQEGVTEGTTNELTWTFETYQDTDAQ